MTDISRMKLRGRVEAIGAQLDKIEPRPGVPDAAPAHDPYGDALATAIGAIFFDLVMAGIYFSAGKMRAGDKRLMNAEIKTATLRAQRRNAPQSRRT